MTTIENKFGVRPLRDDQRNSLIALSQNVIDYPKCKIVISNFNMYSSNLIKLGFDYEEIQLYNELVECAIE